MSGVLKLLEEAKRQDLYEHLVAQVNKDFQRAGVQERFDAFSASQVFLRNLTAAIYDLIVSDFETYLTVLYTIDVSEAKIKALPVQQVHELATAVTVLIMEREYGKVSFKNKP